MFLSNLPGAPAVLQVEQSRPQCLQHVLGRHMFGQIGAKYAVKELIQRRTVPPPVHVAFAEAQTALPQDAGCGSRIPDLVVPGGVAVDANAGTAQKIAQCTEC